MLDRIVDWAAGPLLWLNIIALMVIKLALPLGDAGVATITDQSDGVNVTGVVEETNRQRIDAGLPPLTYSIALSTAAQAKLDDMARQSYFAHVNPQGLLPWDFITQTGYRYIHAGENLARGFREPDTVVAAWMASPTHRANIVHTEYDEIGVASRRITLNGRPSTVVVQMFAAPQTVAVAAVTEPAPIAPEGSPNTVNPAAVAGVQSLSTAPNVAEVTGPARVIVPVSPAVREVQDTATSVFAVALTLLLVLLAYIAVHGHRPRLLWAMGVHAGVLLALTLLPAASGSLGVIF